MADIFGAFAEFLIQTDVSLRTLGEKISEHLEIQNLRIENKEYEPYDEIILAETLGFELEIKQVSDPYWPMFNYTFSMITSDSFLEISEDRMFDLSFWMARYVSLVCNISTLVVNKDKKQGRIFYREIGSNKRCSSTMVSINADHLT